MSAINLFQAASTLAQKPEQLIRSTILDADSFSISLFVYTGSAESRLHDCGKDEFFYVLKGEVEMQVEDRSTLLKEGDGILIKANDKHKHRAIGPASMMLVTKQPHKHNFYD